MFNKVAHPCLLLLLVTFHTLEALIIVFDYGLNSSFGPHYCGDSICSDVCIESFHGYGCACTASRVMTRDGVNCTDRVGCQKHNGGCEQRCVKHREKYVCECEEGFDLSFNGYSCIKTVWSNHAAAIYIHWWTNGLLLWLSGLSVLVLLAIIRAWRASLILPRPRAPERKENAPITAAPDGFPLFNLSALIDIYNRVPNFADASSRLNSVTSLYASSSTGAGRLHSVREMDLPINVVKEPDAGDEDDDDSVFDDNINAFM